MRKEQIRVLFATGIFCAEHSNGREINELLRTLLLETGRFEVKICEEFRGISDETLADYDVVFINYEGKPTIVSPARRFGEQTEQALYRFVSKGKGAVFYHGTTWVDETWPEEYKKLMGGYFKLRHGRRNPISDFTINRAEEKTGITKYMPEHWITVEDDMFAGVTWVPGAKTEVLCTAYDDVDAYRIPGFPPEHHPVDILDGDLTRMSGVNQENAQAWVNYYGQGRAVVFAIGHGEGTIKRPGFMTLFIRGLEWAATGTAFLLPPGRSGDKRLIPWLYYHKEKNPAQPEA